MKYPIETRIFKCSDDSKYEDRLTAQLVQANLDLEHLLKNEIPKNETGWVKQEHINEMKRITEVYEHILQRQNEKKREIEGEVNDGDNQLKDQYVAKMNELFQDQRVRDLMIERWDGADDFKTFKTQCDLIIDATVWQETEEGHEWWYDVYNSIDPEAKIKELKGWT
jgi:hypothetical protein